MVYECPTCKTEPGSHSLKRLADENETAIFYTCPAEATKYWDLSGILEHYDGTLGEHKGSWVWVFDAKGFSWSHALQFDVAMGIARLITEKYSGTLEAIRIVNPTPLINFVRRLIWPVLNKKLKVLLTN